MEHIIASYEVVPLLAEYSPRINAQQLKHALISREERDRVEKLIEEHGKLSAGSLYSATKWAVSALAASIRAECVGTGVRVTLIQPGLTDAGPAGPERQADPKLSPADVAAAVMYAVGQPAGVDVSEIVIRPVGQDPFR